MKTLFWLETVQEGAFTPCLNKSNMKKNYLTLPLLCCMAVQAHAASMPDSVRCDFTGGIPEAFTLIDADGNAPSKDLTKYDFEVGKPWTSYYIEEENNFVAASTSWYEAGGTSSDWMILPPIEVKSEADIVAWRAKATDKNYRDGYALYVTTGGGTSVNDFDTTQPLYSVKAEEAQWTRHSVSLAQYVGQTIRIAFVNNSTDCSVLYLDDVFVGTPATVSIRPDMNALYKPTANVVVKGQVFTDLDTPVKGFTVYCQSGDNLYQQTFSNAVVTADKPYDFELVTGEMVPLGETANLHIWAEHDGQRGGTTFGVTGTVNKVVVEELTGTWCGFCVQGIVMFDDMKKKHPNDFIGLAVHGGDFMQVNDYHNYIYGVSGATGYPTSIVNRVKAKGTDVKNIPYIYKYFAGQPVEGGVFLSVADLGDGQYTATSRVALNQVVNDGRYRMAYTVVENDVYKEGDDRYKQHNSYAGGNYGAMGGYEDLPNYVEDFHFQDVVRGSIGDVKGIEGSLPAIMVPGQEYVHTQDFTLPSSVLNAENTELVAMLIDTTNGRIVNADKVELGHLASGISTAASQNLPGRTEYYTLGGTRVQSLDGAHGVYIVREVKGGQVNVYKVRR